MHVHRDRVGGKELFDLKTVSRAEDAMLSKELRVRAYKRCDPVVAEYVDCSRGRTISLLWACDSAKRAMKDCLAAHLSEDAIQEYREQYLRRKADRARAHADADHSAQ